WATNILPYPAGTSVPLDEVNQTVTFLVTVDKPGLFSAIPSIDSSGNLTFQTAPGATGTATITVAAQDHGHDAGTANGGVDTSNTITFTITITPATSGITVTSSPTSPSYGQSVTY